ncbi:MAG: hypothetical protein ABIC95_01680 [archaeon]
MTEKRVCEVIAKMVGDEAVSVVKLLKGKENVSEFLVAKKLNEDIQVIRNILYRLHSLNLATYKRVKDRQKGWYIGYWTFNILRARELYAQLMQMQIERFEQRLKEEQQYLNNYYICKNVCVRMNFDEAADLQFHCPECGTLLDHQHNERTIEVLQEKIKEISTHS